MKPNLKKMWKPGLVALSAGMYRKCLHLVLCLSLSLALEAGCGDRSASDHPDASTTNTDSGGDPCTTPASLDLPSIPSTITENTANTITSYRTWNLIGNAVTPTDDTLQIGVIALPAVQCVDLWIDGEYIRRFPGSDAARTLEVDITGYGPGAYEVLLAATGTPDAFAQFVVYRSHPYYVLVTNDWDNAEKEPIWLTYQEELHAAHPEMKMTHFVGPYTYTDPAVTPAEAQAITDWVLGMRDQYDDEIGLHIHPYCNFVETTSVTCRSVPSVAYVEDLTGYSVAVSAYTQAEMEILLERSKEIFETNGLGTPTSFRAGAWTAEIHTLVALANTGFVVDTSALNWARLEEWQGVPNATLYEWNQSHWSTIDELSQPYYPSENDILSPDPPIVPILEVPDNGNLVDYVTDAEIIEMFDANWPGKAPQEQPTTYVTGYHPGSFGGYRARLEAGLTYIDQFLHVHDDGPVIYETISNMALVWPIPE